MPASSSSSSSAITSRHVHIQRGWMSRGVHTVSEMLPPPPPPLKDS